MFGFNKTKKDEKKTTSSKVIFTVSNMHCSSCAMNIDGALEETKGVIAASTNFAQAKTTIEYDAATTTPEALQNVIEAAGYQANPAEA